MANYQWNMLGIFEACKVSQLAGRTKEVFLLECNCIKWCLVNYVYIVNCSVDPITFGKFCISVFFFVTQQDVIRKDIKVAFYGRT